MSKKEKINLSIIFILIVALILTITYVINNKNDLKIANNNITALTDSITKCELENGELMHHNHSLVIEKDELEKYLDISKQEIKELEKKLDSKILYISKLEGQSKIDTIYIENKTTTNDSLNYRYSFMEYNEFYTLCGYTDVDTNNVALTTITENTMKLNLSVGLDKDWKIFVKTDNPYITFSTIDGALVDKNMFLKQQKKKRFSIGIQAGFGAQYGLMHKQFDYGPYIGIGLEYNFISW